MGYLLTSESIEILLKFMILDLTLSTRDKTERMNKVNECDKKRKSK